MESDAIIGIQDMGAAGLTSSSVEMASKGGAGIELWIDKIPAREADMSPYDFMLSESQERMLMTLKPGREAEAERIFEKWGLDAATIGVTTDTGRLVLTWHNEIACDLPLGPLADEAPKYERPWTAPKPAPAGAHTVQGVPFAKALTTLMSCPDMASKRWIWEQYDRDVMADTVAASGAADAAIVRIHGSNRALAVSCDVTPRYVENDPFEGGKQAVAECWRNLCAVGATPLAMTDNLNFGSPQRPEIMGQIVAAIEGMAEACRALDFPVVSGNVSLYNETNGRAIPPTPAIGGVGLLEDMTARAGFAGLKEGDVLILVGETKGALGASLYLRELHGREGGAPPRVDLAIEKRNGAFVRGLISDGFARIVHDLSDGGLGCAAAELALANDVGVYLEPRRGVHADVWLWSEDQARYLIAVPAADAEFIYTAADEAGVTAEPVGIAGGCEIAFGGDAVDLAALRAAWEGWLPGYMAKAA
jgi:phosphoribosylformylglycinamidine synthase